MQNTLSQTKTILKYLQEGNTISPLEALEKFGCFRLGARIWELKDQGFNIQPTMVKNNGKHFASYKLVKNEEQCLMPFVA